VAASFDFIKRLGSGYFGVVWKVRDTGLNAIRALKLIPPDKVLDPNNFSLEAQTLQAVKHSNVVEVLETGHMHDGRVYVAMEYLEKGSLEDEASGAFVKLTRAKRVMVDVLRGLEHAHFSSIVHRDIKPGNIMIGDSSEGKLSDFGLALPVNVSPLSLGVKAYNYLMHLAPEVRRSGIYTERADLYACGVTLYRLVNGDKYLPFVPVPKLSALVAAGKFPDRSKYREFVPRSLRIVINKAMNVDPNNRFVNAREMRHALEQVAINMNWDERVLPDGMQWISGWNERCYEVVRRQIGTNRWSVTVRKGRSKRTLRINNQLSLVADTKAAAEKRSSRVLQDFVLGRQT
jgi:serine/threonine-protein kinase